jgi:hypothetical protein
VALDLTVSYLDSSPEGALEETARRSDTLVAILDGLGVERERWTTTGVSISEETEWDNAAHKQMHRGYRATNRLYLRLADAALIGRLLREATGRASAAVRGPFWSIAPDNPAHDEARGAAAADARRRAEAYATALGARLGAIQEITEPGITPKPPRETPMAKTRMMAMAADAAPELEVQPGELHVSAAVVVTFGLEQG